MIDLRVFCELPANAPAGMEARLQKELTAAAKRCYGIQSDVDITVVTYPNTRHSRIYSFILLRDARSRPDPSMERSCRTAVSQVLTSILGQTCMHMFPFSSTDCP